MMNAHLSSIDNTLKERSQAEGREFFLVIRVKVRDLMVRAKKVNSNQPD